MRKHRATMAGRMTDSGTVRNVMVNRGAVDEGLRRAAAAARREYLRAGLSMPVWRSGRLVWVEPTELKQYEADGHIPMVGRSPAEA